MVLNLLQDPGVSLTVKGAAVWGAGAEVGLMAGPGPAVFSGRAGLIIKG
ncbi:hypothetical protein [Streptomyces ferrugineus]|nr:hypothetical protein [Streptomyces ferrugineus]